MVSFVRTSSAPPLLLLLLPAAAAAALILCAFAPSPSSASKLPPPLLLGIAPEDEHYYSADVIPCRDGSGSFPRRRLNDGFCDCPDGTDEPGTPACPEARFYCRNIGDVPSLLYSSRVNDRICDCCDGSDESDGRTTCVNTCRRDQATSTSTDPRPARRQAWRWGVGVERIGEDLADLRAGLAVEFVIVSSVLVTCFCYWFSRTGRRRYMFKS